MDFPTGGFNMANPVMELLFKCLVADWFRSLNEP